MPELENQNIIVNSEIYTIKLQFNDGRRFEATTCSKTNQLEAVAGAIALMEYIDRMPEPTRASDLRLEAIDIDECIEKTDAFILELAEAARVLDEQQRGIIVEAARSLTRGQMPFTEYIKL